MLPGFLVQFGLSGNVTLQREWDRKVLPEERAIEHKDWNMRGTIAFATSGAGGGTQGRSTQVTLALTLTLTLSLPLTPNP